MGVVGVIYEVNHRGLANRNEARKYLNKKLLQRLSQSQGYHYSKNVIWLCFIDWVCSWECVHTDCNADRGKREKKIKAKTCWFRLQANWDPLARMNHNYFFTFLSHPKMKMNGGVKGAVAFIGNTKVITFERLISMTLHHKSYIYHLSTLQMINTFMDVTAC